ncbi:MFS transporter [Mycolicibacterium fortuitum]|uniref:Membrane transporter n=1 Tax=Mycolicibacterium fortuitum subsp. fortuitum DSM 46621 = ATCC 6841 = JCM 6387 TaxID=1214102 RepID=K0VJC0_MYCFO|nr:putative membrane transport protein [Mycobacterium sp. VKM Ac-1817D]EJZ11214.1 membrane transporter [Mycolicibacterium fortuitum subsp. fortuitum DSM 46621 = ATCC 6841 = JCM 6387]BDD98957.1 MFS transporter [Mycolicibacterium fortuitum subsp. fortuitum]CRL55960.1 membrane transporter [Mycolicibacterium fortuitum subsp. fortuitum DSM 46621 = ATCC 6841 = JCM 6387]CRL79481.1 membrane transporter [Mycolicibacter nonchromogenicus]
MARTEFDRSASPAPPGVRRPPGVLIAGLSLVALTVAVLQTAVVPILGIIARQLNTSSVAVSWAVTANLLAAAASTPLIGRLADLYSKKRVLLGVLVVVLAGSVLAAVTASVPLLVAGRILQGASYALYPISIAILREELAEDRLVGAMSVLSGTLGFGGGVGLVVTGLLMSGDAGYHRVFWLTTVFTAAVIVVALVVVPNRRPVAGGAIDWLGAAGLATGLSAVLLAITQGNTWGWSHPGTLGFLLGGIVVLTGWWYWERRAADPLVSTTMLARRPILLTNLATILVGMGLYFAFLGLTQFVQMSRESAGYGFGAGVLQASVYFLLPGALTGFVVALVSGRYIDRYGARRVLVVAAVAGITGFVLLAVAHDRPWQVVLAGVLANAYISLGYGALPALVVSEVEASETGIATSMNAIARTIGSSVAAAVVAVLLGHRMVPAEGSFVTIFIAGAVTAALAMTLIAVSRAPDRHDESVRTMSETRAMNHEWG